MATVKVSLPQELAVRDTAEVLVAGGGPGGIGAAVAAARNGADVLLVEHYGFLGGMASAGEVNPFMPNHLGSESLDQGIFEEWLDRMGVYGGRRRGEGRTFDPNVARLAAEDLCIEAGVRLLYHHRVAHVEARDRKIETVVLHSKSGLTAATAKQYIDCTGDGDLAALAGCRFEYGSGDTPHGQPMTMCFKLKLSRQDVPEGQRDGDLYALMHAQWSQIQEVYKRAQKDGRISCPRENVLMFRGVDDDVVHFNTTRVIRKRAIDGHELSEAEVMARKQLREIWKVLREELPFFRNSRIHSIAPQIGIRESRRIVGRAYVTLEDYKAGRTYPDGIERITYPVDIHNPNGTGTVITHLPKGVWYEIPWGALLPKDIDNLAIGSRCISADHATHSSLRVMPPVCSLGQAAGTAAGMAIKAGVEISAIDGVALKRELVKQGRNLPEYDPHRVWPELTAEQEKQKQQREVKAAKAFTA